MSQTVSGERAKRASGLFSSSFSPFIFLYIPRHRALCIYTTLIQLSLHQESNHVGLTPNGMDVDEGTPENYDGQYRGHRDLSVPLPDENRPFSEGVRSLSGSRESI